MKKTTKELLDDLLEDGAPPEFHAALLDKTLRSARRRQRVRRFNLALGAMMVAGICAFSYWKTRERGMLPPQLQQTEAMVENSQSLQRLQPGQVVTSRSSSVKEFATPAPTYVEVVTTGSSGRYQIIDDQQSFALRSDKTPMPSHPERAAQTATVKKRSEGTVISQIAFKPEKPLLGSRPNIRHLQCTVNRASQPPKGHRQIKGKIKPAIDGNDEG